MRNLRKWGLLLAFSGFLSTSALSQSDRELATYYFEEGSYQQAVLYLEQLWKHDKSQEIYDMYYASLVATDDFERAEDLVKKRIRSKGNRATAYVDLGELYVRFDRREQAMEAFNEALELLGPGVGNAQQLANAFVELNELDLALAVYEKSAAMGTKGLAYNLANLQGIRGDYPGMLESFCELLHERPTYLRTVQNSIHRTTRFYENPEMAGIIRTALLRAMQAYPEDIIFPEMLVWYFNALGDFAGAFQHARSLDLRLQEDGARLMELGNTAVANKDFATARQCFEAVVEKGPDSRYFYIASNEVLQVRYAELEQHLPPDLPAYRTLAEDYAATLDALGLSAETAVMAKDLAHLKAFYTGDIAGAIALLEQVVALPGLYDPLVALCKLELGDIYVFDDNIWEASLLFSQVELDFGDDPMGHEAKFRNARVSYFGGNFDWAQSQLDALKASTSKLISNDAIDLSLLITDNYALDTITEPMERFARAELLALQHRYPDAEAALDSLLTDWPGHALEDDILYRKAKWARLNGRFEDALTFLADITALHFDDVLADDALYWTAKILDEHLSKPSEALTYYEQLLFDHPGSLYVIEARERFRTLNPEQGD